MPPEFRVTLDISADNEEVVEPWAVKFLTDRGFNVTAPHSKWESLTAFCRRVGVHTSTVDRKLRPWDGRPNVSIQRSTKVGTKKPRILAILSNPDFDAYCVANK
jgi:hypothetical protein